MVLATARSPPSTPCWAPQPADFRIKCRRGMSEALVLNCSYRSTDSTQQTGTSKRAPLDNGLASMIWQGFWSPGEPMEQDLPRLEVASKIQGPGRRKLKSKNTCHVYKLTYRNIFSFLLSYYISYSEFQNRPAGSGRPQESEPNLWAPGPGASEGPLTLQNPSFNPLFCRFRIFKSL